MKSSQRLQTTILLLGDLIIFYLGLYLALMARYQTLALSEAWRSHQAPFFWIHVLWLFIFFVGGAYDIRTFISYKKIFSTTLKTMSIAAAAAVLVFYITPSIRIAPKTNLFIDVITVSILLILWRRFFWFFIRNKTGTKTLFLGRSREIRQLIKTLRENPHFGYNPALILESAEKNLAELAQKNDIQLMVASRQMIHDSESAKHFYKVLPLGISVVDFESFYESLTEKVPVSMINEEWFLENLDEINKKTFEKLKRVFDITAAIILGIITLLLTPLVALFIKMEGRGPVFYRQKRVGKNGIVFEAIKFRSMLEDAEKEGVKWAKEDDPRITKIGSLLRKTRLDELPQTWNVLKGEMSFIGPRPERPEFVKELEKQIPHYAMRHLVKPGLSGWAQIKLPHGGLGQEGLQKLQYDLYYIKNRSLTLDLAIAAKTIATIVGRQGC